MKLACHNCKFNACPLKLYLDSLLDCFGNPARCVSLLTENLDHQVLIEGADYARFKIY